VKRWALGLLRGHVESPLWAHYGIDSDTLAVALWIIALFIALSTWSNAKWHGNISTKTS
jgi:hypothetical protein